MSNEETLKILNEHVSKLQKLLDDPQPGLFTWVEFYGKEMRFISDVWEYGLEYAQTNYDSPQDKAISLICQKI